MQAPQTTWDAWLRYILNWVHLLLNHFRLLVSYFKCCVQTVPTKSKRATVMINYEHPHHLTFTPTAEQSWLCIHRCQLDPGTRASFHPVMPLKIAAVEPKQKIRHSSSIFQGERRLFFLNKLYWVNRLQHKATLGGEKNPMQTHGKTEIKRSLLLLLYIAIGIVPRSMTSGEGNTNGWHSSVRAPSNQWAMQGNAEAFFLFWFSTHWK